MISEKSRLAKNESRFRSCDTVGERKGERFFTVEIGVTIFWNYIQLTFKFETNDASYNTENKKTSKIKISNPKLSKVENQNIQCKEYNK